MALQQFFPGSQNSLFQADSRLPTQFLNGFRDIQHILLYVTGSNAFLIYRKKRLTPHRAGKELEAEEFTYFRIPRLLITSPRFRYLSTEAKLLYGMMLDRMSLSVKNEWYDENGRVYIYFTVEEICEDMNCGRDKAMKLLGELDTRKGVGLIVRVKQGQGKGHRVRRLRRQAAECR